MDTRAKNRHEAAELLAHFVRHTRGFSAIEFEVRGGGCLPSVTRPREAQRGQAPASVARVASSASGRTFTSASTGMKFVSPAQRGTTCRWTWPTTPAPAIRPRFQPRLNPAAASSAARVPSAADASRWISSASSAGQLAELALVPDGRDHQVPGRVRVLVHEHERVLAAVHDEPLLVAGRGRAAQKTQPSLLVRRLDVLEPPGRPELPHR